MVISHIFSQISRFMLSKPQISSWLDIKLGQLRARVRRYIDIDILNVDKWALVKLSAKSHVSCCPCPNLKYLFWLFITYLVRTQLVFICNLPLPSWAQLSVWMPGFGVEPCFEYVFENCRRMFFNRPSQFSEPKKKTVKQPIRAAVPKHLWSKTTFSQF